MAPQERCFRPTTITTKIDVRMAVGFNGVLYISQSSWDSQFKFLEIMWQTVPLWGKAAFKNFDRLIYTVYLLINRTKQKSNRFCNWSRLGVHFGDCCWDTCCTNKWKLLQFVIFYVNWNISSWVYALLHPKILKTKKCLVTPVRLTNSLWDKHWLQSNS